MEVRDRGSGKLVEVVCPRLDDAVASVRVAVGLEVIPSDQLDLEELAWVMAVGVKVAKKFIPLLSLMGPSERKFGVLVLLPYGVVTTSRSSSSS